MHEKIQKRCRKFRLYRARLLWHVAVYDTATILLLVVTMCTRTYERLAMVKFSAVHLNDKK